MIIKFPSPRGSFFICIKMIRFTKVFFILVMFPSPMGIFFISMRIQKTVLRTYTMCFRPLGGFFYFYGPPSTDGVTGRKVFPSPLGSFFISMSLNAP